MCNYAILERPLQQVAFDINYLYQGVSILGPLKYMKVVLARSENSAAVKAASHSTCHILFPVSHNLHVAFLLRPACPVRVKKLLSFSPLPNISNCKEPYL